MVVKLQTILYPEKRLEWLEENAPELLETYLRSPNKLMKHLEQVEQQAMWAVFSMMGSGMARQEAEEVALSQIVYPETDQETPERELSTETRKRLRDFKRKYLNLYR